MKANYVAWASRVDDLYYASIAASDKWELVSKARDGFLVKDIRAREGAEPIEVRWVNSELERVAPNFRRSALTSIL